MLYLSKKTQRNVHPSYICITWKSLGAAYFEISLSRRGGARIRISGGQKIYWTLKALLTLTNIYIQISNILIFIISNINIYIYIYVYILHIYICNIYTYIYIYILILDIMNINILDIWIYIFVNVSRAFRVQ